jgi:hypothetical protein
MVVYQPQATISFEPSWWLPSVRRSISGDTLLAAHQGSDEIASFRIDPLSGIRRPAPGSPTASPSYWSIM